VLAITEVFITTVYGSTITLILGVLAVFANSIKKKNTNEHNSTVGKIEDSTEIIKELNTKFEGFLLRDREDKKTISTNIDTLHSALHTLTLHLLKEKSEDQRN
jgi:hypothetical protein